MTSILSSTLMEKKIAELQEQHVYDLQTILVEAVGVRFPTAPIVLMRDIRRVTEIEQFRRLIIAVIRSANLEEFRQQLTQIVPAS